jgi:dienelactone hydrolase
MVLAHGSGGIEKKDWERWVPLLNKMGVATFVVDSFAPRGIAWIVDDQSQLDQSANDADALAALNLLATDPRIDPARIGVIGFSRGGIVALETAVDRLRRGVIRNDLKFAAHIAFYPGCTLRYWRTPSPLTGAPIMMALGELDNYTPARPCLAFADAMKAAGQDIEAHVYAGAQHDFDSTFTRLVTHSNGTSSRNCRDREIDPVTWEYHLLDTGEKSKDLALFTNALGKCVVTGVTTGGNPAAAVQAENDVRAFITRVLHP